MTDNDIRWWWGLHGLERRILEKMDDLFRAEALLTRRDHWIKELTAEIYAGRAADAIDDEALGRAAADVRKGFPMFGDPNDTPQASREDRPLPPELKDRVSGWSPLRATAASQEVAAEGEHASSMNALIRAEIRAGRL